MPEVSKLSPVSLPRVSGESLMSLAGTNNRFCLFDWVSGYMSKYRTPLVRLDPKCHRSQHRGGLVGCGIWRSADIPVGRFLRCLGGPALNPGGRHECRRSALATGFHLPLWLGAANVWLEPSIRLMSEPAIFQKSPIAQKVEPGTYWWCACGRSQGQPFCDGTHKGTGFAPKKVEITEARTVAWCGCKHSQNAPFCDGTHSKI